jgi:hypothetical protein
MNSSLIRIEMSVSWTAFRVVSPRVFSDAPVATFVNATRTSLPGGPSASATQTGLGTGADASARIAFASAGTDTRPADAA